MNLKRIVRTNRNSNPFSGISFVINAVEKAKIPSLINKKLGKRAKQAKFSYSDAFLGWIYSNFCGADRLEDTKNLKNKCFQKIHGMKYASPDSIALIFKSFATPTVEYLNKDITHEFNINPLMNELMLDVAMKLEVLNTNVPYTLDYDNTIIETEKQDSSFTYKQSIKGYQPGICFLGKIPVYIEGRNGNSNAKFKIDETLQRSLGSLDKHGVKVNRFRSDVAAYKTEVINMMDSRGIEFFIRTMSSDKFRKEVANPTLKWEKVRINFETIELAEMIYQANKFDKEYRVVVRREENKEKYRKEGDDEPYTYYGIMTNNTSMSGKEVFHFYNQRGAIENNFAVLKNDFNLKRIPFSFLNQNTVFMIVCGMADIIYQYIIRKFSKVVNFVKKTFELKKFIQYVISISAVFHEDGTMEIENTEYNYEVLLE